MRIDRRALMTRAAAGAGGALFAPFTWPARADAAPPAAGPMRVVFLLQNHGFNPGHSRPAGVTVNEKTLDKVEDVPLKGLKLPEFIDPLAPYLDKLTVVQNLNGRHVSPYHGGPYGALGGFKKSSSAPAGETVDCALARALPAVVPLLALGWETTRTMQASPIAYASSAWGANKAVPMYCDPVLAFNNLFGVAKPGKARDEFEADTELYDFLKTDAAATRDKLAGDEREKFRPYLEGFEEAGARRRKLLAMAATLERHAPPLTDQFTKPKFETDLWEAGLSVAVGALKAGVTNVVTIASGMCHAGGSWHGAGLTTVGHTLGHTNAMTSPDWLTLQRYNMGLLVRVVKALEAVPEGKGTMMDNTVIVYTSDMAESQHSTGNRWPFLLIGDLGGRLRTGRYVHYPLEPHKTSRTVNALYATLLHAAGAPRDRFNLAGSLKDLDRPGPLPELLR
ncbi:MAG: hypothetical protein C0501_30680 [Isosphaera sp.]|nr:hypothetical protein [Isosphaera sp.]